MILLYMHVMIGNYDGAVFRYLLLMCDFIDQVDWSYVEDFRAFASAVYPFLNVSSSLPSLMTQIVMFIKRIGF